MTIFLARNFIEVSLALLCRPDGKAPSFADAGVPLLCQVDRKLEWLGNIAPLPPDDLATERIRQRTLELPRQRVHEIVQGNEDPQLAGDNIHAAAFVFRPAKFTAIA